MPARPRKITRETLGLLLGGIVIVGTIAAGWFPRDCPLLAGLLGTCRGTTLVESLSITEKEKRRIPHRQFQGSMLEITAAAREVSHESVGVRFALYGPLENEIIELRAMGPAAGESLALISSPALRTLSFPRIAEPEGIVRSVYVNPSYKGAISKAEDVRNALPEASKIAVDRTVAREWQLPAQRYTALESLTSEELAAMDVIVTSYAPPTPDGAWNWFSARHNLTQARTNANEVQLALVRLQQNTDKALLVSTVSLDYSDGFQAPTSSSPL